jgi:GDPmannose 4,6-dehydratase
VKDFLQAVFGAADLDWREHVEFDERYLRPAEVDLLIGDYTKAKKVLGWEPQTRMSGLAKLMFESDLALAKREARADAQ